MCDVFEGGKESSTATIVTLDGYSENVFPFPETLLFSVVCCCK